MQVSVTFTGAGLKEIHALMDKLIAVDSGALRPVVEASEATSFEPTKAQKEFMESKEPVELAKPKRHRRTKEEMEAARAAATTSEVTRIQGKKVEKVVDDETEEPGQSIPDYGFDEPKADKKDFTLEGDIMPAFFKYSQKYGRPKAGEVLKKYVPAGQPLNVKSINPDRYSDVLRELN